MASALRRRGVAADDVGSSSMTTAQVKQAEKQTREQSPVRPGDKVKVVHHKTHERKRNTTLIFLLGGLVGLIAAGFFAQSNDLIAIPEFGDLSMDSLLDVIPAGLVRDFRDLSKGKREFLDAQDAFTIGLQAETEGFEAHFPMIMIPGVISTGLESWGTGNISRPYFRKRLWGSWTMMRALVLNKEVWKRHIMLDRKTGLDPPGIKLRAAQGFDATDFFITGYWIWNKIFENLAPLGYDPTNAYTAAYDWRLSYANLEVRDKYFTRLRNHIEGAVSASQIKVVLTSHSMGSQVLFYFFHWVASEQGGRAGADWVDKHIEAWINISGCMLGAVKGIPAVLSGEMKDTAQLNAFAVYGLDKFLSKEERAELFRAMPGISSMLPIGGNAVWGNMSSAPDDQPGQKASFGSFMNFRQGMNWTVPEYNMTVEQSMKYLLETSEDWYQDQIKGSYSHGVAKTTAEVEANEHNPQKWINPLETRLPLAPNLKIYCFYGVGKPTERAYYYRSPEASSSLNVTIDTALINGVIDHGVVMGEGDGTVSLLSTGYMCNKGWQLKRYNPAGVKVTVVEMSHEPDRFNPRGGANTADHVDILGRSNLNEYILRIASGRGHTIENNLVSNIKEYADKVEIYEE